MPSKYQTEIRAMFLSVFKDDHFLHNVNQDDAIGMTLAEMGWTYEEISDDLETGLANGISVSDQLHVLGVAVGVYLTI